MKWALALIQPLPLRRLANWPQINEKFWLLEVILLPPVMPSEKPSVKLNDRHRREV
ncbi:hypothetical protein D3C87_2169560 [compost metagenome]